MKSLLLVLVTTALMAQQRNLEGKRDSPVRVVIYEDLQCSDCANFRIMLDLHLMPKYAAKVAFEHRDLPLPKHKWARRAAIAARYFDGVRPELGLRFRQETMARMKSIPPEKFDEYVAEFAKANGTDGAKAVAALNDASLIALVEEETPSGAVMRSPFFFT